MIKKHLGERERKGEKLIKSNSVVEDFTISRINGDR